MFQIKNGVNFKSLRRQVENSLGEKGGELKAALLTLLDELEASEVEYDEEAMKAEVLAIFAGIGESEVPEAVQNSIAKAISDKVAAIQNSIGANVSVKDKFTPKVKNQISAAVLKAQNKLEVENAVNKVLVENQITGLVFSDVIDYTIATKWENSNSLYAMFQQTKFTKFHYTTAAMNAAAVLAKQWDKESQAGTEKSIQQITATPKTISTDYIYKRQQVDAADMDEIEIAGEATSFLAWITGELATQTINTIVMAILVGDAINQVGERVTTFETIGTKTVTDIFTYVGATAGAVNVQKVRAACDKVINREGKKKVLCISQSLLTALSGYVYAAGGDTYYRSKEEMAGQFGVDEIYVTDLLGETKIICLIPGGYWIRDKKTISISYPTYAENRMNYQYEKNIGGAIHDLQSTALLNITAGS